MLFSSTTIYPSQSLYPQEASIIDRLITDRTSTDVARVAELKDKIINGTISSDELIEWNSGSMKGAYNFTDFNRIYEALYYIAIKMDEHPELLIETPEMPTAWNRTANEFVTKAFTDEVIDLVEEFVEAIGLSESEYTLPTDMTQFSYTDANNLELTILAVNNKLDEMIGEEDIEYDDGLLA